MEVPKGVYMDASYKLFFDEGARMTDNLPEDLNEVVHPHWSTFPPQHPLIIHGFGIFLFLSWLVNFIGNSLVVYVFLTTKELRTPTNMFTVNLAISDLLMATSHNLVCAINTFICDYWMFGPLACKLFAALGGVFGTVSLLMMMVIGYDRYNTIVKGLKGEKISKCKALSITLAVWIYCICCASPPFFGWGGYQLEGMLVTCSYDYMTNDFNHKSYIAYALVFHFVVPMSFIIYFYSAIVKAVVSHEMEMRAQAKKMNVDSLRSNQDNSQSAEVRIAKVAVINVVIWFFAFTPYAIIIFIGLINQTHIITPVVAQIPAFCIKLSSCINPVVFALGHPKYREALEKKVPCLGIRETKPEPKPANKSTVATSA